jgi:hypothetical protein
MSILPEKFIYDEQTRQLDVEWPDGSITRYFEIDPRLAFLDPTNQARNRDFLIFINEREHNLTPHRYDICNCPLITRREVVQEATKKINKPQTRPLLVRQQSEGGHT